jgi:hypothetical protein
MRYKIIRRRPLTEAELLSRLRKNAIRQHELGLTVLLDEIILNDTIAKRIAEEEE